MTDSEGDGARVAPAALIALLFVSGAAALADEVVWVRILAGVFGTTAGAAAVVLACFMAGAGAGALVLGRLADRSRDALRLYGFLEIAGGALAVLVPLEARLVDPAYGAVFRAAVRLTGAAQAGAGNAWALTPARIALASLMLLPPAFALGGALPALVRYVVRDERRIGFEMGRLYAANTAGAVLGCFVTGFALLMFLGVTATAVVASLTSIAVGVVALALSRRTRPRPVAVPRANGRLAARGGRRWTVPALYAASGFAALGCEVLWTRALVFILNSTVYAFTSMLTVFLLGLAGGGAAGAFLARRVRRPVLTFALLEAAAAVSVAAGLLVLRALAAGWLAVDRALGSGWIVSAPLHLGVAAALMLAPTFVFGMIFPVVGRLHGEAARAGESTGEILLANTVGGAAGALAAGFVLVPLVGTARSILALAGVNLLVAGGAVALLTTAPRAVRLRALAGALVVALAVQLTVPGSALDALFAAPNPNPKARLVRAGEGPGGIVTVHRYEDTGWLLMSVNGVSIAGTAPLLRTTQVLQGVIPSLVHGRAARVLQIGIGTGETSRMALGLGARRLILVEISPEVVTATERYFGRIARDVLGDDRLALVYADGKAYVGHSRERFDLVLSDSTYPFLSGSSGLYTLDYFLDCRERLAPGGLVSAWLPLDIPERGLRSVLRTFAEAFPHATLWTTSRHAYKHALLLGSSGPIRLPYARIAGLMADRTTEPRVGELLEGAGVRSVEELAASVMLDRDAMLACAGDAPLHTDERPVLEYETQYRAGGAWRARLAANMELLGRRRVPAVRHVDLGGLAGAERERVERALERAGDEARRATARLVAGLRAFPHLNAARGAWKRGSREEAERLYLKALEIDPGSAAARAELGRLYLEMGRVEDALRYDVEAERQRPYVTP